MIRIAYLIVAALPLLAVDGCRASESANSVIAVTAQKQTLVRTELFFGSHRKDGNEVTDWQWRSFVNDEVSSRFPQGFTVLSGDGQWRNDAGVIEHERSWIVIIVHERSPDADRKVEQIRQAYKDRFKQESVLRADSIESVSF